MDARPPQDQLPPLRPRAPWNVLRVPALARRWGRHSVFGVFAFVSTCVSLGVVAFLADAVGQPLVVPSLGPTAFIVFDNPRAPSASPRNALFGHAVGIAAGYVAVWIFGLTHAPAPVRGALTFDRAAAAALSLGATAGVMALTGLSHPPAAATTLIVSLGFVEGFTAYAALMGGVVVLLAQGFVIDRLAGLGYPIWRPRPRPDPTPAIGKTPSS